MISITTMKSITIQVPNEYAFIYEILHGKKSPTFIQTNSFNEGDPQLTKKDSTIVQNGIHKQKKIDGLSVDDKIPTKAIGRIIFINAVRVISSCQGISSDRPTYLIVKPIDGRPEEINKIVTELNKQKDIKAGSKDGQIGITTNLWYDKDPEKFKEWWNSLEDKIKYAIYGEHM